MIKFFLLLIIVITSSYIGYLYGNRFRKRAIQLNELLKSIIDLQNEITYTLTPLPEAFINISAKVKEPLNEMIRLIGYSLENNSVDNVYSACKASIMQCNVNLSLLKEDTEIMLDLCKSIGGTGIDGQVKIFALAIERTKNNLLKAEKESDRYSKMYQYLGVCAGLMIAICLV